MRLWTKFFFTFSAVTAFFFIFMSYHHWITTNEKTTSLLEEQTEIALSFELAIRKYIAETIRPRMYELIGSDNFEPETMSTSFIARAIFMEVKKTFPDFIIKFSSTNPRNPANLAGPAEQEILDYFNNNPEQEFWKGKIIINGELYIGNFKARRIKESCLHCHGNPADAPDSLIERYGPTAGFHLPTDDVSALDTVAIPMSKASKYSMDAMMHHIMVMGSCLAVLFFTTIVIFRSLISTRLTAISKHFEETASQEKHLEIKPIRISGQDEISHLAENFNILAQKLQEYSITLEEEIKERANTNQQLLLEISEREKAEQALKEARINLEHRVDERTQEVVMASVVLEKEILERELAEAGIKTALAELDQIFNIAADGMRVINSDYEIIKYNKTFLELTHFPNENIVGKKCFEVFPGPTCRTPNCPVTRILAGATFIDEEVEKERLDGTTVPCILVSKPYLSPDGEIIGIIESFKDITERKKAEDAIRDREEYLRAIMATIQTGVLITDSISGNIIDVNPCASEMIGLPVEQLAGMNFDQYLDIKSSTDLTREDDSPQDDCILLPIGGKPIHVRRSIASVTIQNQQYLVQSFLDITDMINLLKQQEINIVLARKIMGMINGLPHQYTSLNDDLALYSNATSIPCHEEGGDHFFVKTLPGNGPDEPVKTIISVKDQSGHAVNCVLRSIITDLTHNTLLQRHGVVGLEQVITHLNNSICHSDLFGADDFFTSINAEINHQTLLLRFISTGHPPFFLIRDHQIQRIGRTGENGTNLPAAIQEGIEYSAGELQLQEKDKLIFYTDGIFDIPYRTTGSSLNHLQLMQYLESIIKENPEIRVAEIVHILLKSLSEEYSEEISPYEKNTSNDDITLIALEIESQKCYIKQSYFPQNTKEIDDYVTAVMETLNRELIDEKTSTQNLTNIRLALTEAFINAWKHGNNRNPSKAITIQMRQGNDLILEVADEGDGFDYHSVPDPTAPENLTRDCGRGIFIINNLASSVRWNNHGRHIVMSFQSHSNPLERDHVRRINKLISLWGA
ncbi:DUF3365 domain-containing protein [Thermodesulfobacteriota bacterium]